MSKLLKIQIHTFLLAPLLLLGTGSVPVVAADQDGAAVQVRLLPSELKLDGPESRHRVLIERYLGSDALGIAGDSLQLVSDNPAIVRIEDGMVVPVGNGQTMIRVVTAADADSKALPAENLQSATAGVTVTRIDAPSDWTFRNHVQPVLAKLNCSSGACHGALAGKGGFRLSLRGYDLDRDHFNIVHQQQSRRVEFADPGSSLLLTKPTMAVPHKGGLRFETGSLNYRVISEWIAAGAVGPSVEDAELERLEILPERVTLSKSSAQPLLVRAHYSDGRTEDVTQWAKFTSSNEAVATVNEQGIAQVVGPGEGAVTAWFSSQIVIGRITVPYDQVVEPSVYTHTGRRNFIDELVLEQLRRLNLQRAQRCSDDVFIRRAFLDTIGTLPAATEVRQFLTDASPDKRDRLIQQLLERPEFVDYWTYRWSDLLLINGTAIRPDAVRAYYKWVRSQVEANTPWDQFVTELITASGSSFENGATNFYALHQAPEEMAENVSQAFLGLSIGCAKCHNHPLEKWTNDQYYGFANLFSRVRAKGWGGDPRNGDGNRTLVTVSSGELIQPRTGKPQLPTPLDAEPISLDAPGDRREHLARWLTAPQNSLFSRSITNRIWHNFFGVGLVEEVDDMRTSNPASNEELLAAAAQSLVDADFNLKTLMRTILQSATYQRSSHPSPQNEGDQRHYSRYFPRRLMAEVLLDAVSQVTDIPTEFTQVVYPGADVRKTDFYPKGTRAIQLYDSAVDSYFLQTFGRNQRRITCECERSDEPSMVQVLHLTNGNTLNEKLQAKDNRLQRWLASSSDDTALVDDVFLTCLARFPNEREQQELLSLLAAAGSPVEERRDLLEDIVWGILSSREFLFNH